MRYVGLTLAAFALLTMGGSLVQASSLSPVDVQNSALSGGTTSNALLNSNGGLGVSGFESASGDSGASLWLRARDIGEDPGQHDGSQFVVDPTTMTSGNFRIDFQFTPRSGDTLSGGSDLHLGTGEDAQFNNYFLQLEVDSDPGESSQDWGTSSPLLVFDNDDSDHQYVRSPNGDIDDRNDDGDTDDPNETDWEDSSTTNDAGNTIPPDDQGEEITDGSWDDGDSMVVDGITQRGGTTVDFAGSGDLPAWVVVNSWKPEWIPNGSGGFPFTTPTSPGFYDIRLTAYDAEGEPGNWTLGGEVASLTSRTHVTPTPTGGAVGLVMFGMLASGGRRWSRRRREAEAA